MTAAPASPVVETLAIRLRRDFLLRWEQTKIFPDGWQADLEGITYRSVRGGRYSAWALFFRHVFAGDSWAETLAWTEEPGVTVLKRLRYAINLYEDRLSHQAKRALAELQKHAPPLPEPKRETTP